MNLLVLDLEPDLLQPQGLRVRNRLSELGYTSLLTAEKRVALDLAAQGKADLVFCCGLSAVESMAELGAGVGIVCVCTTEADFTFAVRAMRAGANDIWVLDSDADVVSMVDSVMARSSYLIKRLNAEVSEMRSVLEQDQRAGRYIQMGMLPPNPMGIGHYRMQHRLEPSLILSGDFVDYFQITDRYFACYVADVSGHGASSAFVTVLLKNFSRRLRREYRVSMLSRPGEILSWINDELIDQGLDKHVAMFVATVDLEENVLHYANAAHLPPAAMVTPDGIQMLEQKGKPLGLFEEAEYPSLSTGFTRGNKLIVFSDGVLDLIPRDTLKSRERYLSQAIAECHDMDSLWAKLDTTKVGADDVSCLLVHHGN